MRRETLVIALSLVGALACGDNSGSGGPYDSVPVKTTIKAPGLSAPVDIVRDSFGVPHIYARSEADAAFADGYVTATDRLLQLDLIRHFAEGRVGELFGALDASQLDGDIEMRMHRIGPRAADQLAAMQASSDPKDQQALAYIERYADGVNFYVDELKAGKHTLDPAVTVFLDPSRFEPWQPTDSLAAGLLEAWSLSYDVSDELSLTDAYQQAHAVFDDPGATADLKRRAGAGLDLFPLAPVWKASTIDGWPNYPTDTGSRAKPSAPGQRSTATRPVVPKAVLDAARYTLRRKALGHIVWRNHLDGSNNWVVGPALAGGKALLANDPHLSLSNPPVMHARHITVENGVDMEGVSLAGVPGVLLGHNAHLAWGATTAYHDVSDFYAETLSDCPPPATAGTLCVDKAGTPTPLTSFTETIKVGAGGTVTDMFDVTYQVVPGHGPIVPAIDPATHRPLPIAAGPAISVRYTGYDPSAELRATFLLEHATSVQEGFDAMNDFKHGAQNWVMVDDQGNFGWTSTARIPRRSPGCFSFDAAQDPQGVAPFFVVPADGTCEWTGDMDARYVPHAINPAQGYLATANHDPVGESFDGNLLNGPMVDGAPLYAGGPYAFGSREWRITQRLLALKNAGQPVTLDDLASIQTDAHSNVGELVQAPIADAIAKFQEEVNAPGSHPELSAFVAGMSAERRQRLIDAGARLAAWTLDTPAATDASASAGEIADSSATSIFNVWLVDFMQRAFGDELAAIGRGPDYDYTVELTINALTAPASLRTGLAMKTGEPLLCDDLGTPGTVESCTFVVLWSLDAALDWLASPSGFGATDMDSWRWGKLHRLTLSSLAPSNDLDIPPPNEPDPALAGGYPRHGDIGGIDASTPGGPDLTFTYGHGPCMRLLVEMTPGVGPRTKFALPGGDVFDRSSTFYRNLMDQFWSKNLYFDLPWTASDVVGAASDRTVMKP
jgi:penicillin amidase